MVSLLKPIPAHVLSAFQIDDIEPVAVPQFWNNGLRFGRVVLSHARETSAWSGKAREKAVPGEGLRISRPVRATDGRLIVAGYCATEFATGEPRERVDEAVAAALLYDDAVAGIEAPSGERTGLVANADRAVWREEHLGSEGAVAHLDFLSHLLFDGHAEPVLTEFDPSVGLRPRGFTAALVIVDGLLAGAVDPDIVARWSHIPRLDWLLGKAIEYRRHTTRGLGSDVCSIDDVVEIVVSY